MNDVIDAEFDESAVEQLNSRMTRILTERAEARDWPSEYRYTVARGIVDGRDTLRYIGDCEVVEGREDEVVVCGDWIYDTMISRTDALGNDDHVDQQVRAVITEYARLYFSDADEYQALKGSTDVAVLKREE